MSHTRVTAIRPAIVAAFVFLAIIAVIQPWSEMPLNDDWQYAHVAKTFAERGVLSVDVPVAPTLVGQAFIVWPILKVFGFSHLVLRLTTVFLSIVILFELNYLLALGRASLTARSIALLTLVANPIFLHLSTTFMTENYSYFVALLAACVWFGGRKAHNRWIGIGAAVLSGFAFWIRQYAGLVFPALLIAEIVVALRERKEVFTGLRQHAVAIAVWLAIVLSYFQWARVTGNYKPEFAQPLSHLLSPVALIVLIELGVCIIYMTVFFAPFLLAYVRRRQPSARELLVPSMLILTAGFAWEFGVRQGPPAASLHSIFPFLHNVLTDYGVGPITLTDVYVNGSEVRPHLSRLPWVLVEMIAIVLSIGWLSFLRYFKRANNEIAIFGLSFGLISFLVVVLSVQGAVFDRYHYPTILGLTLGLPIVLPQQQEKRLMRAAAIWVSGCALFSTLGLHDYFRWNNARKDVLLSAQRKGILLSDIDAGYEPNGWNTFEGSEAPVDCGHEAAWFCRNRQYRVGLQQLPNEQLLEQRPVDAWLTAFPDLKLLKRP